MKSSDHHPPHAPRPVTVPWNILVVDADPRLGQLLHQTIPPSADAPEPLLRCATGIDAAQVEMRRNPADLLFINLQIADNSGLELIRSFKTIWPKTQIIAVSRHKSSNLCLDAWRAGASDMLFAPLSPEEITRALAHAATFRTQVDKLAERNGRLRIVCRRLNKARREISQQVDLLCNDLVRAYQDLAQQLNVTQLSAEYAQTIKGELEVEGILRRTMEWILKKLGPVNAAVYLPAGDPHFALGAYLNLDTQGDAELIETLGKTIVEQARTAGGGSAVTYDSDATLEEMFGDDAPNLLGRGWIAVGCRTPRECLAVLVVFRRQDEARAAEPATRGTLEAMAPVLAERIEQALGFYQRLHPFPEEEEGGGSDTASTE